MPPAFQHPHILGALEGSLNAMKVRTDPHVSPFLLPDYRLSGWAGMRPLHF